MHKKITIYLGLGSNADGVKFTPERMENLKEQVQQEILRVFGGLTAYPHYGVWQSGDDEFVAETGITYVILEDDTDVQNKAERLCQTIATLAEQMEVWFTVEDVTIQIASSLKEYA